MPFSKESRLYNLFHQDKSYLQEALDIKAEFPRVKTVLEIGAGTGLLTKQLVALGYKVTVIEPSKEMLSIWRIKGVTKINARLEDVPIEKFKRNQFGLILCLYDVLNYIGPEDLGKQYEKLLKWGRRIKTEVWPPRPVNLITYKRAGEWHRIRIGFGVKDKIHLWFIYFKRFGKGLFVEKHNLYR